jgi:hypothetical protein
MQMAQSCQRSAPGVCRGGRPYDRKNNGGLSEGLTRREIGLGY